MSLLLAPYNTAMRLGQGFNSYTQQICVDDAVVVDPERAENIVTNDGTTMRIMAQLSAKPSAWNRQQEVVSDSSTKKLVAKLKGKEEKADGETQDKDKKQSKADPADKSSAEVENAPAAEEESEADDKSWTEEPIEAEESDESAPTSEDAKSVPETTKAKATNKDTTDEAESVKKAGRATPPTTTKKAQQKSKEVTKAKKDTKAGDKDPKTLEKGAEEKPGKDATSEKSTTDAKQKDIKTSDKDTTQKDDVKTPEKTTTQKDNIKPEAEVKAPVPKARTLAATRPTRSPSVGAQPRTTTLIKRRDTEKERQRQQDEDEQQRIIEQRAIRDEIERENREEERTRRTEERAEQRQVRDERRKWDAQRRQEAQKAITDAAAKNAEALTLAELTKIKAQNQFVERFTGMEASTEQYRYDNTAAKGPSQTVVYSSKFIDRLSDITDDMSISGALSIKAAKIGGSGRGSFVDSDKFKDSDLKFYISVKVTNQTLNFKDALVYNPMDNMRDMSGEDFNKIYGDSFISGFQEGGEFNALVSMKVLNKAKLTDIQAQAKVALTAGPVGITAEANVGIARSNIETNTETTIQVSWCGGGHIKPMEQPWNIESIMQAAARFPDLVAECPQRTYAILTKYDSLRSFAALKPGAYSPLQYENAQLYTNALMDSFMSYKAMYKLAGEQIDGLKRKILEFVPWDNNESTDTEHKRFEASIKGVADARVAMRKQMTHIVNEVDAIERTPTLASKEDRVEPFQSPASFEARVPQIRTPAALELKSPPLNGQHIGALPQTDQEFRDQATKQTEDAASSLLSTKSNLNEDEKTSMTAIEKVRPGIGSLLRVSDAAGDNKGEWFNNLDFVQDSWKVTSVQVEVFQGAVVAVEVTYDNGLFLRKGQSQGQPTVRLDNFRPGERIMSASIETGNIQTRANDIRITAIRLYTNRGRKLVGQATTNVVKGSNRVEKDGIIFENVTTLYLDVPIQQGTFKGFFGWEDQESASFGLRRLGLVWGSAQNERASAEIASLDYEVAPFSGSQSGQAQPALWSQTDSGNFESAMVTFPAACQTPPRILTGLGRYYSPSPRGMACKTQISDVSRTGFRASFTSMAGKPWQEPRVNWLTLPENDVHFEYGYFDTNGLQKNLNQDWYEGAKNRQYFRTAFKNQPKVIIWICDMTLPRREKMYLSVETSTISKECFDMTILAGYEGRFEYARIGWLAFDPVESKNRVQLGSELHAGKSTPWKKETFQLTGFEKVPSVFLAPCYIEIEDVDRPFNMQLDASDVTQTSFVATHGSSTLSTSFTILSRWIAIA